MGVEKEEEGKILNFYNGKEAKQTEMMKKACTAGELNYTVFD